jgi:hypothetical protein
LSKYDSLAASVRQRFLLYAPLLRENGIDLGVTGVPRSCKVL